MLLLFFLVNLVGPASTDPLAEDRVQKLKRGLEDGTLLAKAQFQYDQTRPAITIKSIGVGKVSEIHVSKTQTTKLVILGKLEMDLSFKLDANEGEIITANFDMKQLKLLQPDKKSPNGFNKDRLDLKRLQKIALQANADALRKVLETAKKGISEDAKNAVSDALGKITDFGAVLDKSLSNLSVESRTWTSISEMTKLRQSSMNAAYRKKGISLEMGQAIKFDLSINAYLIRQPWEAKWHMSTYFRKPDIFVWSAKDNEKDALFIDAIYDDLKSTVGPKITKLFLQPE